MAQLNDTHGRRTKRKIASKISKDVDYNIQLDVERNLQGKRKVVYRVFTYNKAGAIEVMTSWHATLKAAMKKARIKHHRQSRHRRRNEELSRSEQRNASRIASRKKEQKNSVVA